MRDWIEAMNQGDTTSEALVSHYLDRIRRHDGALNTVAELNPDAQAIARALDEERQTQGPRSPLHGIPVLLKDNINTKDMMHTTANSLALSDLVAPYEATLVNNLRKAGMVILGKTNLSEFAYFMSDEKMPSGYGSLHGQVKHPYDSKIDPLGSSTGSGVAVAADFVPVAIGTETNGSLMAPAYQNCIVAMKPTLGLVSRHGIIPISPVQDTAGPMGRNVADCAMLLAAMAGHDPADPATHDIDVDLFDLMHAWKQDVKGMKVGVLSFSTYTYDDEQLAILTEAKTVLEHHGLIVEPVTIESKPMPNEKSLVHEFKHTLNHYLESVKGHTRMTSLADIIAFNKQDPARRLKYGQTLLEASDKTKGDLLDPDYLAIRKSLTEEARKLEDLMQAQGFDALISTLWTSYAPIHGNPSICVPAKTITDLKPRGLVFVGKRFDDARLIAIAHAYEQATRHRVPPVLDKQ